MPSQKLTDMTGATSLSDSDLFYIVKPYDTTQTPSGSSYKMTATTMVSFLQSKNLFTGGTVSGNSTFTGGLSSTTVSTTSFTLNGITYTSFPTFTGGTVSGNTSFTGGLSSTTVSATSFTLNGITYTSIPTFTGGTVSGLTNFTGGLSSTTFSATSFTLNGVTYTSIPTFTGGTVSGLTNFTGGLSANTFSANSINVNGVSFTGSHNELSSKQGGNSGLTQYYHLDLNQYSNLALTNTANTFTQVQNFTSNINVGGNISFTGQSSNRVYNAGSGTTVTLNFNNGAIQTITLTGTTTLNTPTNIKDGATYTLIVKQDSVGSKLINWSSSNFKWENGTAPILTTTANGVDLITFISDSDLNLYGIIAKNFY